MSNLGYLRNLGYMGNLGYMSNLTYLFHAVNTLSELEEKTAAARLERDNAIRAYLAEGNTVYQVSKLTGISRQAVMKIRDAETA